MDRFDKAVAFVLKHEGGYVDDANDPGGATNYGISLRFAISNNLHVFLGLLNQLTKEDIKSLTVEQAKSIYKHFWWDKYQYEKINSQKIAAKVFDAAVNMGPSRAHYYMQTAVNNSGHCPSIQKDGVIGPQTIGAINDSDEEKLLNLFKDILTGHYQSLALYNPKFKRFLKGWLKRAEEEYVD